MRHVTKANGLPLASVASLGEFTYLFFGSAIVPMAADEAQDLSDALRDAAGEVRGHQLASVPPSVDTPAAQFMRRVAGVAA